LISVTSFAFARDEHVSGKGVVESWKKLPYLSTLRTKSTRCFLDPTEHTVDRLALSGGEYHPIEHSYLIDLDSEQPAGQIDWPR
jgi:hypothetical protein